MVGFHLEKKGMGNRCQGEKNYSMEMKKDGEPLKGVFTGNGGHRRIAEHAHRTRVRATCDVSRNDAAEVRSLPLIHQRCRLQGTCLRRLSARGQPNRPEEWNWDTMWASAATTTSARTCASGSLDLMSVPTGISATVSVHTPDSHGA